MEFFRLEFSIPERGSSDRKRFYNKGSEKDLICNK